ncbi:hypothetical protein [Halopenitus persicus]|uniref:hypothetical protein n=1 Tax=Halopenitus persicus TaxID=1048396 RepID=UPI000B85A7A7|nr:hypothetical protein [Halopenitus persicus]
MTIPDSTLWGGNSDQQVTWIDSAEAQLLDFEREGTLRKMFPQNLAFPDDSFDTVISTLSRCMLQGRVLHPKRSSVFVGSSSRRQTRRENYDVTEKKRLHHQDVRQLSGY